MEISPLRSGGWLAKNVFQVPQGRRTISPVLSGRTFLRPVYQPLRSWLISGGRSATPLVLAVLVLFLAAGAMAQTNALSDGEIQGRTLTQKILERLTQSAADSTNIATLQTRRNGESTNRFLTITTTAKADSYQVDYVVQANPGGPAMECLKIIQSQEHPSSYFTSQHPPGGNESGVFDARPLRGQEAMITFANSDFWLSDLGLEFFHWPQQKVLKKEVHRSCGCTVLESTNPNPTTNGYSRVVSWIDNDSLGIVEAYAYDVNGKKLKDFYPKSFKKVNGQYQVQSMVMENLQTKSKTWLEFDLKQ